MRAYRWMGLIVFLCVALLAAGCGIGERLYPTRSLSPCRSLDIKPSSMDFDNNGGPGEFEVFAGRACSWNPVVENQSREWLQLGELGENLVRFTVSPNTTGVERTGRIFVGPRAFLVRQGKTRAKKEVKEEIKEPIEAADPCLGMVLTPTSKSIGEKGGIDRIVVAAGEGCRWKPTVGSEADWIDVRVADDSISYRVKPNTGDEARAGVIQIGPLTFSVRQRGAGGGGAPESPCRNLGITPGSKEFDHEGGMGSFDVQAPEDCYWQAQVDARSREWIEMRTLDNSVKFRVQPNIDLATRTGTIIVGAKVFKITQLGRDAGAEPPCSTIDISPAKLHFEAAGGTNSIQVKTEGGCRWNAVVENYSREWLQTQVNGNQVEVAVQPNTGYPRRGRINIGSEALLVEQGGKSL